jgi:hypothetical protein
MFHFPPPLHVPKVRSHAKNASKAILKSNYKKQSATKVQA